MAVKEPGQKLRRPDRGHAGPGAERRDPGSLQGVQRLFGVWGLQGVYGVWGSRESTGSMGFRESVGSWGPGVWPRVEPGMDLWVPEVEPGGTGTGPRGVRGQNQDLEDSEAEPGSVNPGVGA